MPKRKQSDGETRLSPAQWESAALEALAESGLAGLAVEPLARRLGVTKGSFYWHFSDREALLVATLDHWERSYTERLILSLKDVSDPRQRLIQLIAQVSAGGRSDRIHLALANEKHPLVRKTLARITKRRLDFLETCYVDLGQPPKEAMRSALLAYAAYVGLVHLRLEAPSALPTHAAFDAYVEHLISKLIP
jgi:AcrR family transcriptional regulator